MDLVSSSVYEVADLMRDQLQTKLFNGQDAKVTIGSPSAFKNQASGEKPALNLFFYKIQPPGFFPDTGSHETWRVRLHCLVTAFANSNTSGEDELKMIGQVLGYFHENPLLEGNGENNGKFYFLEVVFLPLTSEEINQLWSTFGDIDYRPSLTYEIALVPVEPKIQAVPAPPVASGGATARVDRHDPGRILNPPITMDPVEIGVIEPDLADPEWAPAIAFIKEDKVLPGLNVPFSEVAQGGNGTLVELWVVGEAGAKVDLVLQSGISGTWTDLPSPLYSDEPIPTQTKPENQTSLNPQGVNIDAFKMTKARFKPADLKIEPATELGKSTSFLLYARRQLSGEDTAYSNPLILTITGAQFVSGDGS